MFGSGIKQGILVGVLLLLTACGDGYDPGQQAEPGGPAPKAAESAEPQSSSALRKALASEAILSLKQERRWLPVVKAVEYDAAEKRWKVAITNEGEDTVESVEVEE